MKKLSILILIIIIGLGTKAQNNEKSLLWEVSGNGLEKPSYIFGTIHLIPEKDYFFTETMKEKLISCETLALEIDINMSLKEQINLAKKMMMPKDTTYETYMTKGQYDRYSSYILDSLGIKKKKFKQINRIKPLFASAIILTELIEKTKAYEKELSKIAKKNDINLIGLETAEYQFNILSKISIEDQIAMITDDGLYESNPLDEFMKIVEIYKEQDINEFSKLFKEDKSLKEFEDDLLYNRNSNWIPIIEKQMKANSIFVAVGTAHLPGKKGVLNLLRESGYSVKAIN